MTGFRTSPGTEFHLDGVWHKIQSYDPRRGSVTVVDADGVLTALAIDDLVHHHNLRLAEEKPTTLDVVATLSEAKRERALARIEHISEAMTGYRSGDPNHPRPDEPRPEYDPKHTTQGSRLAAKERELGNEFAEAAGLKMSARTIRRLWPSINNGSAFATAAGAQGPRHSAGRRAIHPDLAEATAVLIADQRNESSKTVSGLFIQLRGRMITSHGLEWVEKEFPSERTWRRYLADRWTPSQINGKARTRGSATTPPDGGYVRTNPTRPGQLVLMDTYSLDVILKGTEIEDAIKGSLVLALDAFSWSIVALRVVEQVEKNLDVTLTLLDVSRPKQMLPGWPSEARWPYVGIPESILTADGSRSSDGATGGVADGDSREAPLGVSGMPIVNPEALVLDNGSTYRAHKTRQVCRQHGIDLLPARAYTPADKAPVERIFGAIRTMLLQHVTGYRGSDTSERGKNTDTDFEWTAQRLEDLLSLWAVMVWQTHILDDHKPAWCPEGRWSPNALYLHGLETSGLAPKVMTAADYMGVLTTTYVKVHNRGVKIRGLYYDGAILDTHRGQPSTRKSGTWAVHYDARDLRHVWFVDETDTRHRLKWEGITGDFPAFSDRHIHALANRVGDNVSKFTPEHLADVLLTQVLPVRDTDGWVIGDERADARGSKHAHDQARAAADAASYDVTDDTTTGPVTVSDVMAQKREERRIAALAEQEVEAAPQMTVSGGMFGGIDALRPAPKPSGTSNPDTTNNPKGA